MKIQWVVLVFLIFACVFGSLSLDRGEFSFVKEPYEMLGGDYSAGYVKAGEYGRAVDCALRSYQFFWTYRPLWGPVIAEQDRTAFAEEEERFGYIRPDVPTQIDEQTYAQRLIVPEPDRFYRHGAGKPLLSAVANVPVLGVVALVTRGGPNLLHYQFRYHMHPVFILVRLASILAGLFGIMVVYRAARGITTTSLAACAAGVFALYPLSIMYFPNLLHDVMLVPFAVLTAMLFARGRYGRAGIAFGFALAAKNSAVFLLPALVVYVVLETIRRRRDPASALTPEPFGPKALVRFALPALAILTVFANPVSYVAEILTPLTRREFDPRGEAVGAIYLMQEGGGGIGSALGRTLVTQIKTLFPMNLMMFLLIPGVPLLWSRVRTGVGQLALLTLISIFPYGLIFGFTTEYRLLLFVPFMALVTAEFFTRRAYAVLLAMLLVVDLLLCTNPMAASIQHF